METTIDKLLNGRFALEQPKDGYRIAVDTLLLASAIPAKAGERALDLGCGVGGVLLALATRVPEITGVGVEIQPVLTQLCEANIRRNGLESRLKAISGNVACLPDVFGESFDHVAMNPPYHDAKSHGGSANDCRRIANLESEEADLSVWIAAAARALKAGGWLSLIHRADREAEIVELAAPLFGELRITPVCPKPGGPTRRVIARARKVPGKNVCRDAPFILYGPDGRYNKRCESILREAEAMD